MLLNARLPAAPQSALSYLQEEPLRSCDHTEGVCGKGTMIIGRIIKLWTVSFVWNDQGTQEDSVHCISASCIQRSERSRSWFTFITRLSLPSLCRLFRGQWNVMTIQIAPSTRVGLGSWATQPYTVGCFNWWWNGKEVETGFNKTWLAILYTHPWVVSGLIGNSICLCTSDMHNKNSHIFRLRFSSPSVSSIQRLTDSLY
jgi:hypothetical protein